MLVWQTRAQVRSQMTTVIAPNTVHPGARSGHRTPSGHCGQSIPETVPETLTAVASTYSADRGSVSVTSGNHPDWLLPEFL